MDACRVVAQTSGLGDALLWLGILLGLVFVGGTVIFGLRRRLRGTEDGPGGDLDLESFRQLLAAGKISPEEFEAARAAILARHGVEERGRTVSPIDPTRVRARPGVDLTGEPLPRPHDPGTGEKRGGPREGPKN